jgi:hypothetical protein
MKEARDLMLAFARQTGISSTTIPPRRYLWTDAFAVCNFLTLYRSTGEIQYLNLGLNLIDQVHSILGRFRKGGKRTGWISGLDEEDGKCHPTAGGLRIGKELEEREPGQPIDESLEWNRDGQYYHYLTKWMHALERMTKVTGDQHFCRWGQELAKAAHKGFVYSSSMGDTKRMYWKMSIDLTHPLVASMGHHDPLDGQITYRELGLCNTAIVRDLDKEISETETICAGRDWVTDDPLDIGGVLFDAYRLAQLAVRGAFEAPALLESLLHSARLGLDAFSQRKSVNSSREYRLAFRELGLTIGLHAILRMQEVLEENPSLFSKKNRAEIEELTGYIPLIGAIENFWREPANLHVKSWQSHLDINMVMLATSLAPDEFLSI